MVVSFVVKQRLAGKPPRPRQVPVFAAHRIIRFGKSSRSNLQARAKIQPGAATKPMSLAPS
jgi:hypothetical protein